MFFLDDCRGGQHLIARFSGKIAALVLSIIADAQIVDYCHKISDKRGNGKLPRKVRVDGAVKEIAWYSLAYTRWQFREFKSTVLALSQARSRGPDQVGKFVERQWSGEEKTLAFTAAHRP